MSNTTSFFFVLFSVSCGLLFGKVRPDKDTLVIYKKFLKNRKQKIQNSVYSYIIYYLYKSIQYNGFIFLISIAGVFLSLILGE